MTVLGWSALPEVDRNGLREARLQAHYAVQWLARAARAYIAPRPDDGHTNLGWDHALGGFATHPLPDGSRLGIKLAELALIWFGSDPAARWQMLALDRRRDSDVRPWLGQLASAKGLPAKELDAASPYEMPPHAIGKGAAYSSFTLKGELSQLAAWYDNAHLVLENARQRIAARALNVPSVRCWPHHLDLDTLVGFGSGEEARTMGIGFSPGDEYYDEPYFYVSLYPAPDLAALPQLPGIGHWHLRDFTAAIAPASRITLAQDQRAEVETYLTSATEIGIKMLA